MFARLYNVAWHRTGRDRPVLSMASIRTALDAAGAGTSAARTDFRYIKRGTLELPGVASDQDYRANYLIYSNDNVHYFGAWIDSIDWRSAGSFAVSFTDDNFTTFAAGATVTGYRTRTSAATWNEAPGDFAVDRTEISDIWGISLDPGGENPIIVYINANVTPSTFYRPRGVLYTPFVPVVLRNGAARDRFQEFIHSTFWSPDIIIAAYVVPNEFLAGITQFGTVTFGTTYSFEGIPSGGLYTRTDVNVFDALTGEERILLNSHDSKYVIRLGKTSINVPFEAVKSGKVTIEMALSPSPVISFQPDWDTVNAAKSPKYAFSDFPQINFTDNAFNQWALKNALPAIGSVVGGYAAGGIVGAAGGLAAVAGNYIGQALQHPTPEYSSGATSSIDAVAGASAAVQLVTPKDRTRAITYYKQFGYPCGHRETMALSSSSTFTFIQSTDNVITGQMPQAAKDDIDAALRAGVRCWNSITIGDYS